MTDPRFEQQLITLVGPSLSPAGVQFLSDLTREQQTLLRARWGDVPVERRRWVLRQLVELAELSLELDFTRAFMVALDDPDEEARATAIDGLWEHEGMALLRRLLDMLDHDRSRLVRETVLRSLARYALLAALGKLDDELGQRVRAALLRIAENRSAGLEARRRAIEAVAAYSADEAVHAVIAEAHADEQLPMQASALYAMGRNLDLRWLEPVLHALESTEPALRYEAARASGELGSQRAVAPLLGLLDDPDREAQLAAVAALGKLGGRAATTALRQLLQSSDVALREAAEEALEELSFNANPLGVN